MESENELIYSNVKCWDDLIQTNLKFLKGEINEIFYHGGPIDQETREPMFLKGLIELNKMGFYTTNSQPTSDNNMIRQKSYLEFNCSYDIALKLLTKMLQDETIYFALSSVSNEKPLFISNIPEPKYNLTKTKKTNSKWLYPTNWNKDCYISNINQIQNSEIYQLAKCYIKNDLVADLLKDSVCCFVVSRNYGGISMVDKLLEYISIINKNV
jgi:hypothetical protein